MNEFRAPRLPMLLMLTVTLACGGITDRVVEERPDDPVVVRGGSSGLGGNTARAGAAPSLGGSSVITVAGSATLGGAGGAGGAPVSPLRTPSICEGATPTLALSEAYIDNFDFDFVALLRWTQFSTKPPSTGFLKRDMPGAFDVGYALHAGAAGLPNTGRNVATLRLPFAVDPSHKCFDLSAVAGISFWAKGHAGMYNNLLFSIVTPASQPIDAQPPGDCIDADACARGPSRGFSPPVEWTHFVIYWQDFSAAWDYRALGLQFQSTGPDYDVWIDELTFFQGRPPQEKVLAPSP